MKFQQRARLVVDGVAGPLTWRALRAAASAKTRPRPVVTVQRTVLRPGATGPAVRELQLRLHMRADGAFGPVTERAVLTYQARHGLKVDGVVGTRTWQAVEKS
jgi:peptidoglycan hydrolase-like protein with peptidoglycan-binding domain